MKGLLLLLATLLANPVWAQNVIRVPVAPVPAQLGAAAMGASLGTGILAAPMTNSALPTSPSLFALHAPSLNPSFAVPVVAPQSLTRGIRAVPVGLPGQIGSSDVSRQQPSGSVLNSVKKSIAPVLGNQEQGRGADQKVSASISHNKFSTIFDGALQNHRGVDAVDGSGAQVVRTSAEKSLPSYLRDTQGQSGEQLLESLHKLTGRNYQVHSYDESRQLMFSRTDNVLRNGVRGVVGAYSQLFIPGTSGDGSKYRVNNDADKDGYSRSQGMNTEHIWPQSYFKQRSPMRSDLHHLMPTFEHPNSERSRLPFGVVPENKVEYRNSAGAKMGGGYFEPPDAVKGRVARSLLYFYTRYLGYNIVPRDASNVFWNNQIETILQWNRMFPPTTAEVLRNDLVEKEQGNRNPFVDAPELAEQVGAKALRMTQRTSSGYNSSMVQPVRETASRQNGNRKHGRRNKKRLR